jgi:hypothetical protein
MDEQLRSQGLDGIVDAIQKDRLAMLRTDAFRSLVFVLLTGAFVYVAFLKKIRLNTVIILLALLLLSDMWPVNKRYLNSRDFVSRKEDTRPFVPSTADQLILNDKDPDFRVLNLTVSVLQDASTSYFHKSIGGYHGAKMRRFQELYDYGIEPEIGSLIGTMQKRPVPEALDSTLATLGTLNMLNVRYIIYNAEAPPLVNDHKLGNAWFVDSVRWVPDADAEIEAVTEFDPRKEAIIDERFSGELLGMIPGRDTTARITLEEYRANYLKYRYLSTKEQVAVFSEVYYDKGWKALIDGKPVPYFRANYLLRAMRLPAGNHTVEFTFRPKSYFLGEKISLASSLILLLLIIGTGWYEYRRDKGLPASVIE